jgi:hypothetical protein
MHHNMITDGPSQPDIRDTRHPWLRQGQWASYVDIDNKPHTYPKAAMYFTDARRLAAVTGPTISPPCHATEPTRLQQW